MRYLPHTDADVKRMLEVIGQRDLDALFSSIPQKLRLTAPLDLPAPMCEAELKRDLALLGGCIAPRTFVGAGAYQHAMPSIIDNILSRAEFFTAYTPYQPEISQGTLTAIFEFQSMMAELTGLDVANASMYDGATAMAEAVLMAVRIGRDKKSRVLVSEAVHPEYRQVLETYTAATALRVELVSVGSDGLVDLAAFERALSDDVACAVVQTPNFFGGVEDVEAFSALAKKRGAVVVAVVPEPVALGLLEAPGAQGADICVGEGLGLTGSVSFGGPGFGFFATKKEHVRQMPGRLVGATADTHGRRGFVLTLSTREQHIRREKATSNICSNQGLAALAGAIALASLGPKGLEEIATLNLSKAEYAKRRAREQGLATVFSGPTFNEFVLDVGPPLSTRLAALEKEAVVGGLPLERFDPTRRGQLLVCTTEIAEKRSIDRLIDALSGRALQKEAP